MSAGYATAALITTLPGQLGRSVQERRLNHEGHEERATKQSRKGEKPEQVGTVTCLDPGSAEQNWFGSAFSGLRFLLLRFSFVFFAVQSFLLLITHQARA
jgi:hypothetical protein